MTEESIFLEALEKRPTERTTYLEAACGQDKALRRAVEALLVAHDQKSLLDRKPLSPADAPTLADAPLRDGMRVGPYTLLQPLGEGGMGSVWVAQQTEPVKRKVALKLIKAGMDSKSVVARFEHERQALALMDHPNIARVLDGGLTADGRPFFVMELINGLPLTKFCDEARLTPRQRLELFVPVCLAVQHAHQKAIVHRDLKPSNILVTLYDGRPVPKVIDFGVAKALAGKLTDESLPTLFGAAVGTLDYMAPEQAGFSALDVDTRADIYSLGVLLYELLTGLKPIDGKRLRQAALVEIVRILQEEEPPRPSTRLSSDEASPSLAAIRQMEPKRLTELLRGELDWIVMKCLEKSRDRRYESANALARDIQSYLADETVTARPPSFAYRTGKVFRRNKGKFIAATVVALALVGGIIGTTLGMIEANKYAKSAATANQSALESLWEAHLNEAKALRFSGRRGQRFESLKAIQAALRLPVPDGRSRDELRNAAIAALCLPDLGDGPEWDPAVGPAVPEHPAFRQHLKVQELWTRVPEPKFSMRGQGYRAESGLVLAALEPYLGTKKMTVPVRLWRVDGSEARRILDDSGVYEEASAFSPDGKQLALGHLDGTVSLYETESGKEIRKFKVESGRAFCMEYHPALPRLAVGVWNEGAGFVVIFDLEGNVLKKLPHPKMIQSLTWRPDGRQLAVGCDDKRIYLWDAETGKQVTEPWAGHSHGGIRLAFNPAGDRLLSNDWMSHLRLWDTRTGTELFRTPEHSFNYVEPGLIGPRSIAKKLGLLRIAEGQELRQMVAVSVHPDGRLAVFSPTNGIGFHNLTSAETVALIPGKPIYCLPRQERAP